MDYNHLFKLAEERFYNKIKAPEERFESWAQHNTKIDHLGGALLMHLDRGFAKEPESTYWILMEDGDSCESDKDSYDNLNEMLLEWSKTNA